MAGCDGHLHELRAGQAGLQRHLGERRPRLEIDELSRQVLGNAEVERRACPRVGQVDRQGVLAHPASCPWHAIQGPQDAIQLAR